MAAVHAIEALRGSRLQVTSLQDLAIGAVPSATVANAVDLGV